MQRLSVLLDRFRRTAGVPAVVGDPLEAELEPVFASLEEIEVEATLVRENANAKAARQLDAADAESTRIAAGWRKLAERERERVTASVRSASQEEAQQVLASAREEADRVHAHAQERMPELVHAVLACVRRTGE